jgi:thioesterase domain-containing protein
VVNGDARIPPAAPDEVGRGEDRIGTAVAAAWREAFGTCGPDTPLVDLLADDHGIEQSRQVHRLLAAIEAASGISLPLTIVFEAPTLAALTEAARRGISRPFRRPVLVRAGNGPPLFVFPGLGGLGFDLLRLAHAMRAPGPIYLNHPRGADGTEPPFRDLNAIVADHIEVIRSVQPHGPYHLLGYSYGGDVALAVARRLGEEGERAGFLGLIEASVPEAEWPYGIWLGYMYRRWAHHLGELRRLSPRDAASYAGRRLVPLAGRVARLLGNPGWWSPYAQQGLPPQLQELWDAEIAASSQYRIGFYDGSVVLFAARGESHADMYAAGKLWPRMVRQFELVWLDGETITHGTMLRHPPGLTALAEAISRKLATAIAGGEAAA